MANWLKKNPHINNDEGQQEEAKPAEEWIWINGFKGTDKDMKCRDYQYEMLKPFDMPEGEEIEECRNGFHLCKNLGDVFGYYTIGNNNRFFEVRALVRKSDVEHYHHGRVYRGYNKDKLVAKSIIFVRELTAEEIFHGYAETGGDEFIYEFDDWTDDEKNKALVDGVGSVIISVRTRRLVELGYSEPFARHIVMNLGYTAAYAVGHQTDLSMDMKAMLIYDYIHKTTDGIKPAYRRHR